MTHPWIAKYKNFKQMRDWGYIDTEEDIYSDEEASEIEIPDSS